jgi:hypothetical protein
MARKRVVMAAVVLASGLLVSDAPEAQAAHKDKACDAEEMCFWKDAHMAGCTYDSDPFNEAARKDSHGDFSKLRYVSCPKDSLNDSISSYRNNISAVNIVLYEHPNQQGLTFCINSGASGNVPSGFANRASSVGAYQDGQTQNCIYHDRD